MNGMAPESEIPQLAETGRQPAWLAPEDGTRFAAFRIVLGFVLLADISHLYVYRSVFSNPQRWQLPIGPLLVPWGIVILCMVAGYRTRAATIANYCCCAFVLGLIAPLQGFSQIGGDSIAIGLSLLAGILPCGAALTWDRVGVARRPTLVAASGRWILAAFLSSIYVDSGIHKLLSPMWRSGFGATTPMGLPSIVWMNTAWLAWFSPFFLRLFGWGVVGFELFFPFLFIYSQTRVLVLLMGIALHVGIAVIYPIPVFAGIMLAIYAGLLPERCYVPLQRLDAWIATRAGRLPLDMRFETWSPLSRRLALGAVVLWGLLIGTMYGSYYITYRPVYLLLRLARKATYVTTGVTSHAVFLDSQFEGYRYQLRLMPAGSTADEASLPYSRGGLFARYVRDRLWEDWWKRAQAPVIPMHDAEQRLAAWADAHWHPNANSLNVRIEARPQYVEMNRIDTAVFSRNEQEAWRAVGNIELRPGAVPKVTWTFAPRPDEELLGDYVLRILGGHSP